MANKLKHSYPKLTTVGAKRRTPIAFVILSVAIVLAVLLYIYSRTYLKAARMGMPLSSRALGNILSRTIPAIVGIICSGMVIAAVSLIFQTATESRILTPSMIGFDAVFVGTQTVLVFVFGAASQVFVNPYINYGVSALAMVLVSFLMYGALLRDNKNNLVFLLMFGLILSGIIRSGTSYLQLIMSANDYIQVQAASSVTINNMNTGIIFMVAPVMLAVFGWVMAKSRTLDVMSIGAGNAVSLGIDYNKQLKITLIIVALGMAFTTALIGSLTFLGLLVVNIARQIMRTHKHSVLTVASAMIAVLAFLMGQTIVEILQFAVPITTVIDLVGCSYMFYLIIRENKK